MWTLLRFNSRTPEGCDINIRNIDITHASFNSRTPEGCDTGIVKEQLKIAQVSIHAPLKGATSDYERYAKEVERFNSRTPEGCDKSDPEKYKEDTCFNSRTPEGCDLRVGLSCGAGGLFQFTHP